MGGRAGEWAGTDSTKVDNVLAHDAPGAEMAPGHALPACLRGGTRTAVEWTQRLSKPLCLADPREASQIEEVAAWIVRQGIRSLNIAGPRESECPGIHGEAKAFIRALLLGITRRSS